MTDIDQIRAFERDVLDRHHETYLFFHYPQNFVISYLLQVYGDTERFRDDLVRKGHTETNVSTYLTNMMHGLGHCVRWMIQRNPELEVKNQYNITYRQIHEMASDFLGWGTGYHMIAQEFVTWSRDIKEVILNMNEKSITFINPANFDYSTIFNKQLLYASRMQTVYESYPHIEMESEFNAWAKEIDFEKPPIANHLKWERAKYSKSFPLLYSKMKELIFPELDELTDFDGYNLKELRQFYALVFINFHFIRWVEGNLDTFAGEGNLSFGSNPLEFTTIQFEKFISNMTGLGAKASKSIVADLTFNPSNFHSSVTIQPFILSSLGSYHILPNLFSQLEPSRMIIGALNKGNKKKKYDQLINIIEKVNLKAIDNRLKQIEDCFCYIEKPIKFNGRQICPDIILIDLKNRHLIVADYKHFIGPITASEVDYKMKELKKAIVQVQSYIEIIFKLDKIGSANITGFSITGIIITHKSLPIPIPTDNKIPIIDLEYFFDAIDIAINNNESVVDLANKIISAHEAEPQYKFEEFESSISVSDWVIKRSQHKITATNLY